MRLRQRRNPMTDVQTNEDGRDGKHFGTNTSHRFQSEAHALSAAGEINPYSCPACKSENTQRLSTAYMSGLSHFSAVTSGFGWARAPIVGGAWITGISQTQLSQVVAPPTRRKYARGFLLLFLGPIIGGAPFAILEHLHGPSTTYELLAASVVILLEIGAVASLLRAVAYNKRVWPELFQQWRSCVMCLRCGQVFRP
jgi:hypothetical protein